MTLNPLVNFASILRGVAHRIDPAPDADERDGDRVLHPIIAVVNRAINTGEIVWWVRGQPIPDPSGPVRPLLVTTRTADGLTEWIGAIPTDPLPDIELLTTEPTALQGG